MGKNKKTIVLLSALLTVIVALLLFIWIKYGQKAQSYECTNFAMGTYVQQTVYGKIGIKVWIFKGEVLGDKAGTEQQTETTEKSSRKQEK